MTQPVPGANPRRAPAHRLWVPGVDASGGRVVVDGDEAHHAVRVKRLRVGEAVEVFDGRGVVISGRVGAVGGGRTHPVIEIEPAGEAVSVEAVAPRVEVCAPVPKGDRGEWMVDQLSQAGAASWRPLTTARGEETLRPSRADKLRRVAVESAKQCGRAHLLEIGEPVSFEDAVTRPACFMAHAGGSPAASFERRDRVWVLIGPEGGWTDEEIGAARARDVPLVSLGPHVARVETAAVLGAAWALREHGGDR